jgi:hypothetical protein
VRRKDLRARDDTGGVLLVDDAHQVMTSDGHLIAYDDPCLPIGVPSMLLAYDPNYDSHRSRGRS